MTGPRYQATGYYTWLWLVVDWDDWQVSLFTEYMPKDNIFYGSISYMYLREKKIDLNLNDKWYFSF